MFSGHGSQWHGMALELLDSSPVFAMRMQACEEALTPYVDWSLSKVLRAGRRAPKLERVDVVQPALFAVAVSLAELWRACGVEPDAVVGHSQGEIAAAYVAGGLSLEDAARVVALRSRMLAGIAGTGGVLSVSLGVQSIAERVERWEDRVTLAAVNGPSSVALSGDRTALEGLLAEFQSEGIRARMVPMDYASHSSQVEAIRDELLAALSPLAPRSGDIPFYSTVTGERLDTARLDGEYWYRAERQTVQFEPVTRRLLEESHRTFIEVSPHPLLTVALQETAEATLAGAHGVAVIGSQRRHQNGTKRFSLSLVDADVHAPGVNVNWEAAGREGLQAPAGVQASAEVQATAGAFDIGDDTGGKPGEHRSGGLAVDDFSEDPLSLRLGNVSNGTRERGVLELVRAQAAIVLGCASPKAVLPDRAFKELGLDSSAAVELRNRLQAATGLNLPTTLVFDHPTPTALAGHLLGEISGVRRGGAASASASTPTNHFGEPLAIVGMACRYPGGVRSPSSSGSCSPPEAMQLRVFLPIAVGIWSVCSIPTPAGPGRAMRAKAAFSTTPPSSMPASLGSVRARPRRWIPSSVRCWKSHGRHLKMRASPSTHCPAVRPRCSWGPPHRTMARACTSRRRAMRATASPATQPASCRGVSHMYSAWKVPPSPWTPRAPPHWWRCTWRARR